MHELSLIQDALRVATESARRAGADRVLGLRLRVGMMSGVVPEALQFAFELVCRGTLAEGATLEIESVPMVCWCGTCEAEFVCEDYLNECPRCHGLSGDLRRGRELEVASVKVA
jgi:hydrogenase nickel incorporation protein HypA/HybF